MSDSQRDNDLNSLIIITEMMLKELKLLQRKKYYRQQYKKRKSTIDKRVEEKQWDICVNTGRKSKKNKPIVMEFK